MFTIEIVKTDTDEVVKTMTAPTQRQAERIERGANINLNHADYHTVVKDSNGEEI